MADPSSGEGGPSVLSALTASASRRYQHLLDKATPHVLRRWAGLALLALVYAARVWIVQGFYIVTYALAIYVLNLLIAFLSPQDDPEIQDLGSGAGPSLPTHSSDEFRPFVRRLPEFKFWYSITKAFCIAFVATFFSALDVPVFWPILLFYWLVLFTVTMKRQILHMIKYKYVPFSLGKQKSSPLLWLFESKHQFTLPSILLSAPMSSVSGIQGQILEVTVVGCSKLRDTELFSRQDPYVCLEYANTKLRTRTCTDGGKNPTFQEKFQIPLIEGLREFNVSVWNSNTFSADDLIGSGRVQLQKVLSQGYDDSSWPLQTRKSKFAGEVKFIMHFQNALQKPTAFSAPSAAPYLPTAPPPAYPPPYAPPHTPGAYPGVSPYTSYPPTVPPQYPTSTYPPPLPQQAYAPQSYPPTYPPQPYMQQYPPPPAQYYPPGPYPGSYPPPY
ncbi:protein RER1A-like [Canna indica]|uniref:Protein RER1A-like n=1 Tax=Canna indica TaxID=4628 RepID=A0AAQ3K2C5_9LILI|nr:protein RER1A-like [Canna indica]